MVEKHNKVHPKLFDEAVGYIQDAIVGDYVLSQVFDNVFGIAERTVKMISGGRFYTPSWYIGGGDYVGLLPDDKLGNYVFFTLDEPQEVEHEQGLPNRYTCGFNIIVWVRLHGEDVDADRDRNREALKSTILRCIEGTWMKRGWFTIDRIYERAENVFQGFTTDEVDNQYLMQPYVGYRFHGELHITDVCITEEVKP